MDQYRAGLTTYLGLYRETLHIQAVLKTFFLVLDHKKSISAIKNWARSLHITGTHIIKLTCSMG